jgi:hypothetical protein
MKVLFYVEPVVFRGDPLFLAPHIRGWALCMMQAHRGSEIIWALASSAPLCELARRQLSGLHCFAIPSWAILSSCGYQRELYAMALFSADSGEYAMAGCGPLAPLADELQAINRAFRPDVLIATGENSLLPLAFPQARCLWMEQAFFPRQKRRDRIYLDPCGHQIGSILERAGDRIKDLSLASGDLPQAEALWRVMQEPSVPQRQAAAEVREAIRQRALGRRIALLVLQPPDGLTWEGCLGTSIPPEALLAQWAAALPPGWVGIPLYKTNARLPATLEASLAAALPQLTPLPAEWSGNVAEWALSEADAVVTVSSSVAGQALISGKQAVVMGRTPLRTLADTSLKSLDNPRPTLNRQQRLALLAFLSHRYTLTLAEVADPNGPFPDHLLALVESADPIAWLLDLSGWTPGRLARLM